MIIELTVRYAEYSDDDDFTDLVLDAEVIGHSDGDLNVAVAKAAEAVDKAIAAIPHADEKEDYSDAGYMFEDLEDADGYASDSNVAVWDGVLHARPNPNRQGPALKIDLGSLRQAMIKAVSNKSAWTATRKHGQAVGKWTMSSTIIST